MGKEGNKSKEASEEGQRETEKTMLSTEIYQGILLLASLSNKKTFKANVKEIFSLRKKKTQRQ